MARKILFFLVVCWLSGMGRARGQADFRPGYVVSLTGDTLRGLADYRGSQRNAEVCRFRPAATAPVTSYAPAQLRGYGFWGGQRYCTRLVAATDSVRYEATPLPQPNFLAILAAGPLTLCQTPGQSGVDRYFIFPAGQPLAVPVRELVPQRPAASSFVTQAHRTIRPYRAVLTEQMADCDAARMAIGNLPFTASALTAIVQRYNACRAPGVAAVSALPARRARERVRLGALAGAETSHLAFDGNTLLTEGRFVGGLLPAVGLSLEIPLVSLNEKLAVRFEALAEQQRYVDRFVGSPGSGFGGYRQVRINLTYLRMPLLLRYTYPTGRARPFAQAGLCYAQRLGLEGTVQLGTATSAGAVDYGTAQPLSMVAGSFVTYEIGLVGSLGLRLPDVGGHALALEVRAERSSGPLVTVGTGSVNQRFFALVGYNFTK